jgi:hypothetical protein
MHVNLLGGNKNKSSGEVWVNWQDDPPTGERIPADMTDRTITVWAYAPKGSLGDKNKPNGFQVVVKDENWKSQYGTWRNIREDEWFEISLTVNKSKPREGMVDEGFNPKRIIAMGVKIGAGRGSTSTFEGNVHIDTVRW